MSVAYLAKDLSPEQRIAIESLLGRTVSEREAVTIRAYEPPVVSLQRRGEIIAGLESYFSTLDAARTPTDPSEADEVFAEAMRQSRPNFKLHE